MRRRTASVSGRNTGSVSALARHRASAGVTTPRSAARSILPAACPAPAFHDGERRPRRSGRRDGRRCTWVTTSKPHNAADLRKKPLLLDALRAAAGRAYPEGAGSGLKSPGGAELEEPVAAMRRAFAFIGACVVRATNAAEYCGRVLWRVTVQAALPFQAPPAGPLLFVRTPRSEPHGGARHGGTGAVGFWLETIPQAPPHT
jgi:hypothetical protein